MVTSPPVALRACAPVPAGIGVRSAAAISDRTAARGSPSAAQSGRLRQSAANWSKASSKALAWRSSTVSSSATGSTAPSSTAVRMVVGNWWA